MSDCQLVKKGCVPHLSNVMLRQSTSTRIAQVIKCFWNNLMGVCTMSAIFTAFSYWKLNHDIEKMILFNLDFIKIKRFSSLWQNFFEMTWTRSVSVARAVQQEERGRPLDSHATLAWILRVCFKAAFYETLTGVIKYHFLFLFQ